MSTNIFFEILSINVFWILCIFFIKIVFKRIILFIFKSLELIIFYLIKRDECMCILFNRFCFLRVNFVLLFHPFILRRWLWNFIFIIIQQFNITTIFEQHFCWEIFILILLELLRVTLFKIDILTLIILIWCCILNSFIYYTILIGKRRNFLNYFNIFISVILKILFLFK